MARWLSLCASVAFALVAACHDAPLAPARTPDQTTASADLRSCELDGVDCPPNYCTPNTPELCSDPYLYPPDNCPGCYGVYDRYWSAGSCTFVQFESWDLDQDGVVDGCENFLAGTFAPRLHWAPDCIYDQALSRPGGEYLYAVQRVPWSADNPNEFRMRLAYLPAYYADCGMGSETFLATLTLGGMTGYKAHTGDSELLLIDVLYTEGNHWVTDRVFLSAHCESKIPIIGIGHYQPDCKWWAASNFQWVYQPWYPFDGALVAPEVWVSRNKHAFYYSSDKCNSLMATFDSCRYDQYELRWPIASAAQNIGSRAAPFPWAGPGNEPYRDCIHPISSSPLPDPWQVECMWLEDESLEEGSRFNGWLNFTEGDPAFTYGYWLRTRAGF